MPANAALPRPDFSLFPRYDLLTELLRGYCAARPELFSLSSIGKSHEGRDIWYVTVTNTATGAHIDKPAFWIDGNIHAAELSAANACLYYINHLATHYGSDPKITHLLDTRTLYIVPRLNPDGAELALADKPRHIRSSTRPYPFDEPTVEGLTIEDVDGDGRMLSMRIEDPNGTYKKHPEHPRLLVPRQPDDLPAPLGGPYYRLVPEGTIAGYDGINFSVNKDKEGLDLNRNFPAFWRQEFEQWGAGPYPTSEPEVRAMVQFVVDHPNIGAGMSFHTHSGVILRPMGTESDKDMIPEDLWTFQKFSEVGAQTTGYPAISIYEEFRYHPKEVITGTQDWIYEHLGSLFWVVEIWSPNKEAGIEGYKWIDWFRDHPVEDDIKLLQWSDRDCAGKAFVDWYAFDHPQLGKVEIGGWDKMNFWRNPPPHLREREAARFPAWLTYIGLALPKLEVFKAEAERLGPDTWRIRFAVNNAGYLPSYISKRALARKVVRGCVFEIDTPDGATLVQGKAREVAAHLEGYAQKMTQHAFLPNREVTGDRVSAEWIVRGTPGQTVKLLARADRAGAVRAEVTLG